MTSRDPHLPIGIFDSGLGGLTVVKAMMKLLPLESLIYLGDTARVPYGTRSTSTVVRYARSCSRMLYEEGIKALIVACNTVSAVAIDILRAELDLPVIGVIESGAQSAVKATRSGRVGVIGTPRTVASGAYEREIRKISPEILVFSEPAPLLVSLVEEGWLQGEIPYLAVRRYLEPILCRNIDVLVLGCTHYPLLRSTITAVLDDLQVRPYLVDPSYSTASEVTHLLHGIGLEGVGCKDATRRFWVTDMPETFESAASRFLGQTLEPVELVDIPAS